MPKTKSVNLTQAQFKHLQERLYNTRHVLRSIKTPRESAKVRAARKVIKQHDNALKRERAKRSDRIDKARTKVDTVMLFGTAAEAIAAVEKFEKTAF